MEPHTVDLRSGAAANVAGVLQKTRWETMRHERVQILACASVAKGDDEDSDKQQNHVSGNMGAGT